MTADDFVQLTAPLDEPMLLVGPDGTILSANPPARQLLRPPPQLSLRGVSLASLLADPLPRITGYLSLASRSRNMVPGNLHLRSADDARPPTELRCDAALVCPATAGAPAQVLIRCRPRRDASGRFHALNEKIAALGREVVYRRRTQAELHAQREWLRVTLVSIGDAVIATDAAGRIVFTNAAAHALTGWGADQAVGRPLHDVFRIVNERTHQPAEDPVQRVLVEGRVIGMANHTILIARDGTEHPIEDSAAPIRDDHDRIHGAVLVFHDVSERRAAEAERDRLLASEREARAHAETANRVKDEFLATLSHELRTPLNAILGWVQLLQMGGLEADDVRHGLEVIERNAKAQAQLVSDLLDVSRIITGKLHLEVRPVALPRVIEAAIDSVRLAAGAKDIELVEQLDHAVPAVAGDPDRLQQVVWNLVHNAIKFTPRHGRVTVTLRQERSTVQLLVSDTGAGISREFLPFIFQRFHQADSSTTRKHGGLGLGLAVARQLVELHGGTIRAQSPGPDRGATFTITLPVQAVIPGAGAPDAPAPATRPGPAAGGAELPLSGVRVVLVDDDPDAREVIALILRNHGADVQSAASAAEALELAAQHRPNVLISDIAMPVEDGYALIARLHAVQPPNQPPVPAIALTAFARTEDRDRALRAGFQAHLSKPVTPDELIATISRLTGPG